MLFVGSDRGVGAGATGGHASAPARGDAVVATGRSLGHHGEILQGAFQVGPTIQRALVSMPCPTFWSEVTIVLYCVNHRRSLRVQPETKTKVRRAVELALDAIGAADVSASIVVRSNIAASRGYGSSTADVTAAIKAVLSALQHSLPIERVAELAVSAEGASDGTLWKRPVLFAHHRGCVVEDFGEPLPPMRVLAFETVAGGEGVDTLALTPARYDEAELAQFGLLRSRLRRALETRDVAALGAVASASTRINQRHLAIAELADFEGLAHHCQAAGMQVAHSGDVASFLFDCDPRRQQHIEVAEAELRSRGLKPWQFAVGGEG